MDDWRQARRQKLLSDLDLRHTVGVEIGPLDHPLVTREQGTVIYVDHADTASLRNKYAKDPNVDIDKIVDVDAVWGDNTLQQSIGADRQVDYVIASHVIEHVPDLISWLAELSEVLKEGGTVRLIVPDRRFTFDLLRRETELPEVLNAYLAKTRAPLALSVLDFRINCRKVDTVAAWEGQIDRSALTAKFTVEEAMAKAKEIIADGAYCDVHCWVFTPKSFALLFEQLATVGLMDFACETFIDTPHHELEFTLVLRKSADRAHIIDSWKQMGMTAQEHIKGSELDRALSQLERTQAELEDAQSRIRSLEGSTSWKATGPLRAVMNSLRGQ